MGTLTKQIYRYTRPRNMRHNENLWPFVKIKRDNAGAVSHLAYKNEIIPLENLSELKGSYAGDILLTATGPSINTIDFSRIPYLPAAGVNGAWHLNDRVDFKIYIIVDMIFFDNKPEILHEIIDNNSLILFTTVHGIIRLVDRYSLKKIRCKLVLIEDKCFPIYKKSIQHDDIFINFHEQGHIDFSMENNKIAFSNDIRDGICDAGTVVYWSLQILAFLGFGKIFIMGLDMNNFTRPRFYENNSNMLPSFLSDKLHNTIIPAFKLASLSLKKRKVEVINLAIDSSIPNHIFTKMDYRDVFK